MERTTIDTINVRQSSEIGRLKHVIWGAIQPFEFSASDASDLINIPLLRQIVHNGIRPFNVEQASKQHIVFKKTLEDHGVTVHEVQLTGNTFSQYGPRDIGFVIDDVFVYARPRRRYRQREVLGIRHITSRLSKVAHLDFGHIEGGDVMLHDGVVLVGISEESDLDGVDALRHLLHSHGIERQVIPIHFSHLGITHLDSKFNIVSNNTALIYMPSFESEILKFLESRFDLISVTREEALDVQINVLSIGDGKIIMKRGCDRIARELEHRGLSVIEVDYNEVTTLGGSFRCTSLPLVRE